VTDLVRAAEAIDTLTSNEVKVLPSSEGQARELAHLKDAALLKGVPD
jgi:hypothetical protein